MKLNLYKHSTIFINLKLKNIMKNLINLKIILSVIIYFSLFSVFGISQTLQNAEFVPLFDGHLVENSVNDIYWDLSEVNNVNNRLDLAAGMTQRGTEDSNVFYYTNGNWYMNEYNSNFNGEDQDLRFIYQHDIAINGINGLLFAKLNSDPDKKNEVIVTREDNKLYVYRNDANSGSIELNYNQRFYCEGKIAATGKFTNDTLEDVAVISGSDVKIYKNLGNSNLDTVPVYTLHNVNADKVIIAQINSYIYPFSIINNTSGDRDEIIIKSDSIIKIYSNNNSNGISDSAFISLNSGHFTDFKIADIDNNGFNDLIVAGNYDGVKVFKNSAGTISSSASYTNTNYSYPSTLAVADFNKDGWNDIIMGNWHALYLFINIGVLIHKQYLIPKNIVLRLFTAESWKQRIYRIKAEYLFYIREPERLIRESLIREIMIRLKV